MSRGAGSAETQCANNRQVNDEGRPVLKTDNGLFTNFLRCFCKSPEFPVAGAWLSVSGGFQPVQYSGREDVGDRGFSVDQYSVDNASGTVACLNLIACFDSRSSDDNAVLNGHTRGGCESQGGIDGIQTR